MTKLGLVSEYQNLKYYESLIVKKRVKKIKITLRGCLGITFAAKTYNLHIMESFVINTRINDRQVDLLVIPDDCNTHSIFHLVVNKTEINKLKYTESQQWEVLEGQLTQEELHQISNKIEEYFFEA